MKRFFLFLVLCICIVIGTNCASKKGGEAVFYISLSGNNSWSGRLPEPNKDGTDGPFATFEKARNTVRALKKEGNLPKEGVTVAIRGGIYPFSKTLVLTAEDSGTDAAPVIWKSFEGEEVRCIGGKVIGGFEPVTDPDVLKRIDKAYQDKIVRVDLKAQGIADYGEITPRGRPGIELFFKGKRMTLARWPNDEWLTIVEVPQTGKVIFEGCKPHVRDGIIIGRHCGRFKYKGDHPGLWSNVDEILMHGYWSWDWNDSFQKVKSIDAKSHEVYIQEPQHGYGYTKNQRFYFLNVLEELDVPGDWCLDRKNGVLYFWPPEPITENDVFVSLLEEPMVTLDNASNVTIQGITFEGTRGNVAVMNGGTRNKVAGCTIRNIGDHAVLINGGTDNGVTSCDIYDVAAGGIVLDGGDRKTLTPGNNYAVNNHIHHFSKWVRTYQWAIQINGVGNRIANNLIHDAPQEAIYVRGNEHVLEYNEIHDIAYETGDVGATHTGRNYTWRGVIYRYNYFHHLHGPGLHGVMGVYLDDFQSASTVYGNIFYKAGRAALIGGGRDNVVENNIFIECAPSAHVDARGLTWAHYYFVHTYDYSTKILFETLDEMNYKQPPYSEKYPELLKLLDDQPAVPKYNKIVRNVSYGGRFLDLYDGVDFSIVEVKDNLIADPNLVKMLDLDDATQKMIWDNPDTLRTLKFIYKYELTFKQGDKKIMDILQSNGNIITNADPGFVDLANGNFQLKDDSPAYKLGFKRIPIEKIGLYIDEYRKTLPEKK